MKTKTRKLFGNRPKSLKKIEESKELQKLDKTELWKIFIINLRCKKKDFFDIYLY